MPTKELSSRRAPPRRSHPRLSSHPSFSKPSLDGPSAQDNPEMHVGAVFRNITSLDRQTFEKTQVCPVKNFMTYKYGTPFFERSFADYILLVLSPLYA